MSGQERTSNLLVDHGWILVSAVIVFFALVTRPLLPVDETRYVGVAWEMWLRGDFLVPHQNGATYAHKPPFLFWAMHLGWSIFGVNEWWPRLVSPLAGLLSLFAVRGLARALWPERPEIARLVPWLLTGALFWSLFSTVTMFDMWNALWASIGIYGIVDALRGRLARGFLILALAIGLGVLSKGPVILLYTLPVALFAPWWAADAPNSGWRSWYAGVIAATIGGGVIALAWALPAANAGGEAYAEAIFWGQTAGRMEDSFAHGRPLWWYLPLLPILVLPWVIWPALWRGGLSLPKPDQWQLRLALTWFLPALAVFSLVSGKQPHYMVPLMPALALMAAHRLASDDVKTGDRLPTGLMMMGLGLLVTGFIVGLQLSPQTFAGLRLPFWVSELSPLLGLSLVAIGGGALALRVTGALRQTVVLALVSPALVLSIHLFAVPKAAPAYDLTEVSKRIADHQRRGRPVAYVGKYHGQFHFTGRLRERLSVIGGSEIVSWSKRHPDGVVIATYRGELPGPGKPEFSQRYRGRNLAIWTHDGIAASPSLFK